MNGGDLFAVMWNDFQDIFLNEKKSKGVSVPHAVTYFNSTDKRVVTLQWISMADTILAKKTDSQ